MKYDYLVVGADYMGSVFAHEQANKGEKGFWLSINVRILRKCLYGGH